MNKQDRQRVYNKFNGRCGYCGRAIDYQAFQVDHIVPQARAYLFKKDDDYKARYKIRGDTVDSFENLMPSCRRCNHYKRSHSLETFRRLMKTIHKRLLKVYIFKVAIDYGIVEVNKFDGKFYFEKEDRL